MKKFRSLGVALAVLGAMALARSAMADTAEWALDGSHSRVGFSVSHLVVSTVTGRFKQVSSKVELDESNLTNSQVDLSIKVDSIDTDEPKRDEHLKSPDFFDAKKFPTIAFKSSKIVKVAGNKYKLTGDLTIHGVTKPITLDAIVSDAIKNPWGKMVRGVKLTGKLNRSQYGLKWNKTLETGGVLVGEEVTLDIQVELDK